MLSPPLCVSQQPLVVRIVLFYMMGRSTVNGSTLIQSCHSLCIYKLNVLKVETVVYVF